MNRKPVAAIYMRLSKEDEDRKEESSSITMQRCLLTRYAERYLADYDLTEFVDDGYSGTNMDRPGVTALLEEVRKQNVDCILVKDFSRFSRDYIELGAYLGKRFPLSGVRFISVGDRYDSLEQEPECGALGTCFLGLLYDFYSKDLSVKVRASLKAGKEKGYYMGSHAPFGYRKAPADRHRLLVEEDEAEVVRRIFAMTLEGQSSCEIARQFNREGVKTPRQFRIEKGEITAEPKGGRFFWSPSGICKIVSNPVYIGDMIYGKYSRNMADGRSRLKPEDEWGICRSHHEPVIERDIFEAVQSGRRKRRTERKDRRDVLTGKLICGCCGRSLQKRHGLNPYYFCPLAAVTGEKGCIRRANAMFLEQQLLFRLQEKLPGVSELTAEITETWIEKVVVRREEEVEVEWRE